MGNITVRCGCGRQMREVGNAPKGTYACGCGARVLVAVAAPRPRCIGLAKDGLQCVSAPVREAAQFGLSLCVKHYAGYLGVLDVIRDHDLTLGVDQSWIGDSGGEWRHVRGQWAQAERERRREHDETWSVVYYVRIGELIKIGTTCGMANRMANLVPDEILATEPGGRELEKQRHDLFCALRVRGERFKAAPQLMAHIDEIRKQYGEPWDGNPLVRPPWLAPGHKPYWMSEETDSARANDSVTAGKRSSR